MRILIVGDLHSKKSNLDRVEVVLQECLSLAQDADITIFLGDLLDGKNIIRGESLNLYLKYFKEWPHLIKIIVGNHDYFNSVECKDHSLQIFDSIKRSVHIVDKVDEIFYGCGALLIPYHHDLDEFKKKLKKDEYLFMHQGVDGCLYSSGESEKSDLKSSDLKQYKRVIAGHIHRRQQFGNIYYVGSPFTQNFGESGEDKGIIILDTETNEIKEIDLDIPKHLVVDYQLATMDDIKELKKQLKKYKNKIIQLRINCPESLAPKIKKSLFKGIDSLKTIPIKEDRKVLINPTLSNVEMMRIYIENMETNLNKEGLIELNNSILEKVK